MLPDNLIVCVVIHTVFEAQKLIVNAGHTQSNTIVNQWERSCQFASDRPRVKQ